MNSQAQKIALPAYLPKRLQAYRIGKAPGESYLLKDRLQDKTYDFEPWQFFILEILPGCEDFPKLASVFEDRFGYPIQQQQVNELLASVADSNLFEDGATHPLLVPFARKGYTTEGGKAKAKSFRSAMDELPATGPEQSSAGQAESPDGDLPAGIQDAVGFDPRAVRKMWTLFDPRPMLKFATPVVSPLRYSIYVMPFIAVAAIFLAAQYGYLIRDDMTRLLATTTLFAHVLFSLFTVNLLVTLTTAFLAYSYRATVSDIGIAIFLGFLPRFVPRISHVQQLTRRERMWLHAAPLIMRVGLFSLGILIWYGTRVTDGVLPRIALALSVICAIGLLFSANPLGGGSGYHLLAAFLDEPHLKGKSYKAVLNRLHGTVYKEAGGTFLAAYALACVAFMFLLMVVATLVFGVWLRNLQLGGTAILIVAALGIFLLQRTVKRFKAIEAAYDRSAQFDRWRNRNLPPEAAKGPDKKQAQRGFSPYVKHTLLLTLLIVLLLPYQYDVSGSFTIFPDRRQELATDIPGVVQEVYFDGGETVKAGTVIARLAHDDYQAKLDVYTAQMQEQLAIVNDLKLRPKPEEVSLAERTLEVARSRSAYSNSELDRISKLYKDNAVSFEDFAKKQREHEVDADQVAEQLAALDLIKTGATKDEIAAAEAKWESLRAERDSIKNMIDRSVLTMPFDGNILTLHLKRKVNSYLDKGEVFATVENSGQVTAEIEVPESDIGFVTQSARIRARPMSYSGEVFVGAVTTIDRNITVKPYGNVVKVIALIDNKDGKLISGMSGYAKIEGESMPVWKAFSLAVLRFVNLQVWSWIP